MKKKSASRLVTDPVCKMELPASEAAATLKFNGQRYYFCHVACQRLFEADPLAYITDVQVENDTTDDVSDPPCLVRAGRRAAQEAVWRSTI